MNISDLREASDIAADRASTSLRRVADASQPAVSRLGGSLSGVNLPDVHLPDVHLPHALDVDVADLAGSAIEFAGDVAGQVVSQGGRSIDRAIRYSRRNPKVVIGVVAALVLIAGLFAARKKRSPEPSFEKIS
ncbi:MAG: hypothetical protein ABJH68_11595 [Ilumatobacter sp.]|uniref:hypothetical protein n=1 Tax=Ilumatobacter sp. TaxID=1967498 RepID=UPI003298535B